MKMTLDRKILAGFVLCAIVLLVVAVISFDNSEQFVQTSRAVNHTHEVRYEFEQILVSIVNAETGARGFVITGEESYLKPYLDSKITLQEHLQKVKFLTLDNAAQQKNIALLEKLIDPRIAHLDTYVEIRKTAGFERASAIISGGNGQELQIKIRKVIDDAKEIEQTLLAARTQTSESEAQSFNRVFIILLLLILAVLVAVYVIIIANLRALRKAQSEAANKNWNLTGSGELAKGMQGNKPLNELGHAIVNHLATYLGMQTGAVYIVEEQNLTLKLAGTYAFDQRKLSSPTIRFGEGIVGQVAVDRQTVAITDIPNDYFIIQTGFGAVLPKNVIIIPIMFEGKVTAVIELGSMFAITDLQREYLTLIADSIAIAITSAQAREKAKELLEETQNQAEELEAQQVELRQANEELHTKTELLERSEATLKLQQEELQEVNVELEEKANMLEEQTRRLESAKTEIETKASQIAITSKYKSEFLANMSHELRTPLNSILILAQLLSENRTNRLGEKEVEYAKNIHNSGADLLHLINEILDLSKVEAGKMDLDIGEVLVADVVEDMSSMFSEIASSKSIGLTFNIDKTHQKLALSTDKQRAEQILKNLLSNAFKFTDKGGLVTLTVSSPNAQVLFRNNMLNKTTVIAFAVSDNGIGIPADKQETIFEAFQQADGSTKRKYGGTGLGLSISRELAHALGGEIRLDSTPGKGSTFTLYLPQYYRPDTSSPGKEDRMNVQTFEQPMAKELPVLVNDEDLNGPDDRHNIGDHDRKVLIVEDDKSFAHMLLDFVRERGYKGIVAYQGNTGLHYARQYKPDAILLDMKLPVMDGMEVLRRLKTDPALRHIPVQILSSYDQKKDGLALGAFGYVHKPVSTEALQTVFDRVEGFTKRKLKKLLIVEDNQMQNHAIRELIGNGDVKSFSAYSGEEAGKMMEAEMFDCIIVDLGLPGMSGFELLERIKENERLQKIPVIVYTGKDLQKEDNIRLRKLADTVVLKTVDSQERLLDETILFLHRVESKLPREKQNIIRKLHRADEILNGKKILIVDDDIRNIYSLTNALADEGLHCLTADNGKMALEMLANEPSIELVLMDVMMPEMDGYEATQQIRMRPEFKNLPIIALTAKAMKGDREKCLAVGMSDYISKPVNIEQLLSLMRVWLYR